MIGEQHFIPIKIFGDYKKFEQRQKLDQLKNQLISENKSKITHFIRISHTEELSEINIKKILQEHKIIS